MDIKEMLTLRHLVEKIAGMGDASYNLTKEEIGALGHLDEQADQGEAHRLHLLRLARLAGIEPGQLMYLRRLAGLGVTVIE